MNKRLKDNNFCSLVSILIPCYNHQLFVADCLQSIISQTYSNIEVIILDDCSTDDSFTIIKSWESRLRERFNHVIIDKNPSNMGITKNLNKLISLSKGEYLKLLASDDMLVPTCIEESVSITVSEGYDLVCGNAYVVDESVRWNNVKQNNFRLYCENTNKGSENLTDALLRKFYICAPTLLYPRATFEKFGLFDTSFSFEDWEYCLRISTKGKIGFVEKPWVYYRYVVGSASHFDVSIKGREKNRKFYKEKKLIFTKYVQYATRETEVHFYNKELAAAIVLYDKELAKEVVDEMKQKSIRIEFSNKIRIILFKTGIYPVAKKMKHIFKR